MKAYFDSKMKLVFLTAENPCELNCMPRGENFYYRHRSAVVDGTPCHPGRRDVCVDGVCKVGVLDGLNVHLCFSKPNLLQ